MKMEIKLRRAETIEFEEFELKESNLRKINIDWGGKDSEGLWAYFSDEDIVKYDEDYKGGKAVVVLANSPICFYPNNLWGAFIPVDFRGSSRPRCDCENLDGTPVFHSSVNKEQQEEVKSEKS